MFEGVFYYRPNLEAALTAFDKSRLKLPIINLAALYPDFSSQPVVLKDLPTGSWSSPLADTVMLAKIALCLKPLKVLEVGSYRGHTAKLLAEHSPAEARIVAVDRDERHGIAYRNAEVAHKIERRVCEITPAAFANDPPKSFDLIFLDADHAYEAVKRDTEALMPLLAPNGMFVWHDYGNWGRFSRKNGVPEFLHELAATLPVVAIDGSWLAAHAPAWSSPAGKAALAQAIVDSTGLKPGEDAWTTQNLRG